MEDDSESKKSGTTTFRDWFESISADPELDSWRESAARMRPLWDDLLSSLRYPYQKQAMMQAFTRPLISTPSGSHDSIARMFERDRLAEKRSFVVNPMFLSAASVIGKHANSAIVDDLAGLDYDPVEMRVLSHIDIWSGDKTYKRREDLDRTVAGHTRKIYELTRDLVFELNPAGRSGSRERMAESMFHTRTERFQARKPNVSNRPRQKSIYELLYSGYRPTSTVRAEPPFFDLIVYDDMTHWDWVVSWNGEPLKEIRWDWQKRFWRQELRSGSKNEFMRKRGPWDYDRGYDFDYGKLATTGGATTLAVGDRILMDGPAGQRFYVIKSVMGGVGDSASQIAQIIDESVVMKLRGMPDRRERAWESEYPRGWRGGTRKARGVGMEMSGGSSGGREARSRPRGGRSKK